jgi:hypothetical protein
VRLDGGERDSLPRVQGAVLAAQLLVRAGFRNRQLEAGDALLEHGALVRHRALAFELHAVGERRRALVAREQIFERRCRAHL